MTEHMPRPEIDFYPEEIDVHNETTLAKLYDDFYHEARRLQKAYAGKIQLLVGMEVDWIRDSSLDHIQDLLKKYPVDLFVGSVHHVHTVPIDFDTPMYHQARDVAGGTDERIYADYFDSQYEMLKALKPPVVGHFDLIRLKGDEPDCSFEVWPQVWEKIERNLKFIASYGGVVELNTSAIRKGMDEAYPQSEICKVSCILFLPDIHVLTILQTFKDMGGRFTFSCDSHGVEQVGLNYAKALERNIQRAGISELYYLAPTTDKTKLHDARFPTVCWEAMPVDALRAHPFFQAQVAHEGPSPA